MQYLGSKNRLAKDILPIIQSYITQNTSCYIEPFVGGANLIDKIKCDNRIGYDSHEYLIALLNQVKSDKSVLPNTINQEEYNNVRTNINKYPKWYVGLVGFCGSYSAKWFGGYAKGNDTRDRQNEAIRNLTKQSDLLQYIKFECMDFRDIEVPHNSVVYCDPPYKGTTEYKTGQFPYDEYYQWVRKVSRHSIVICSEYWMPDDFECIWEKETKALIDSNRSAESNKNKRVEKLFIYRG